MISEFSGTSDCRSCSANRFWGIQGIGNMPRILFVITFALVIAFVSEAAEESIFELNMSEPLTLDQCIGIGLERSPRMRMARLDLRLAKLDVADAFHLGEATLAALAIIVGHIFSVHYNPHVYPMNKAFIDGKISESLMKEEHPLWLERELAKLEEENENAPEGKQEDA